MEERTRTSSRHVRTEDLLPEPDMTRALLFAGVAAFAGAAVWGALAIFANVQIGWIAVGIGALIGLAIVKGGGHGQMLAVVGAVLAVLAIGTGRYATYQAVLDHAAEQGFPAEMFDAYKADAAAWKALGANPTDEQIGEFALDHDYDVDDAAEFRSLIAPRLVWLAESDRSLDEWRSFESGNLGAQFGFVEYLKEDFSPIDILFVLFGIVSAFGIVSSHTTAMQRAARAQIRAEREAEAAEAAAQQHAAEGDDEEDAPRT